jgi:hypothetical protein
MFTNLVDEAPANVVPLKKLKKKPGKAQRGRSKTTTEMDFPS